MSGTRKFNEYQNALGGAFNKMPKSVLAACAVSGLTSGGSYLEQAQERVIKEWYALYRAGVVPQKPTLPEPGDEYAQ